MVSGINNVQQSAFQPQISARQFSAADAPSALISFDEEDSAIISSEAKLLNELDKFNRGGDNLVDLALANVMARVTVEAEVNVIQTKKEMFEDILDMVE